MHHYFNNICLTIFFSITTVTEGSRAQNPRVVTVQDSKGNHILGVRVHYFFTSGYLTISFRLQSMATLKEGDHWQMWEFIPVL